MKFGVTLKILHLWIYNLPTVKTSTCWCCYSYLHFALLQILLWKTHAGSAVVTGRTEHAHRSGDRASQFTGQSRWVRRLRRLRRPSLALGVSTVNFRDVRSAGEAALLPDVGLQCRHGESVVQTLVRPSGRDRHPRGAAVQVHDQAGETVAGEANRESPPGRTAGTLRIFSETQR